MNQAPPLPFFPILEDEAMERARKEAVRRIIETKRTAWRVLLQHLVGIREMPPRRRLAFYRLIEERIARGEMINPFLPPQTVLDEAGQPVQVPARYGNIIEWFRALEMVSGEEAAWMARDYVARMTETRRRGNGRGEEGY